MKQPSLLIILLCQFVSLLIYVLVAAAIFALVIEEWSDAGFIIGTMQEFSAQRAATALQLLVSTQSRVLRDGDAVDVSLLVMAHKAGIVRAQTVNAFAELDTIPFESERLFSASMNQAGDRRCVFARVEASHHDRARGQFRTGHRHRRIYQQREPASVANNHCTAGFYLQMLAKHSMQRSMSRKGHCHDDAVAERSFRTLNLFYKRI